MIFLFKIKVTLGFQDTYSSVRLHKHFMKLTITHKTWRWRYCTPTLRPSRRFKPTIAADLLLVLCCNALYSAIVAIVWTCFIFMGVKIIGHLLEGAYSMMRLSRSEQVFSREPWTLDVFWRGNFCPISLRGYAWLDKLTPRTLGGREARTEERSSFYLFLRPRDRRNLSQSR